MWKIGWSGDDPRKRTDKFLTANPFLNLEFCFQGNRHREQELHDLLAFARIRGDGKSRECYLDLPIVRFVIEHLRARAEDCQKLLLTIRRQMNGDVHVWAPVSQQTLNAFLFGRDDLFPVRFRKFIDAAEAVP
jgi:hypothetical protein